MRPGEATRALREVDALRRRTLGERRSTWFPLVLFGVLALGAAVACEVGGDRTVAIYWAAAGPAGGIATGAYAYRRSLRVGVAASPLPYLATAVAVVVTGPVHGCAILSATFGLAFASTGLALRGRERG